MAVDWQEGITCAPLWYILVIGIFGFSSVALSTILFLNNPFNIVSPGDVPTGSAPNYAWLFTVLKTYDGPVDSDGGLTKYGFHVWGWWAACYGGGAWSIPGSAGLESRVDELDLPSAISKAMFPCGVFLIITLLVSFFLAITTLLSMRYRPLPPPSARWSFSQIYSSWKKYYGPKERKDIVRYRSATIMIAWRTGAICYSLLLLGSIPILICVAIAKSHFSGIRGSAYQVHLSIGAQLLIGVLVADAFAFILIWWHKLMPQLSKKDPKVKQVPIV